MGSNPIPGASQYIPGPSKVNGDVFNFLWQCSKDGYRNTTVRGYGKILRNMTKYVDINSPEDVKEYIARKQVSEGRKEVVVNCYANYCQWKGLSFGKPVYHRVKKFPFVPLEADIDALVADLPGKASVFCQLIKETGARPGEAWNLQWIDVNPESRTVTVNCPEKNSNPRVLKVSASLIARLPLMKRRTQWSFKSNVNAKLETMTRRFQRRRKVIANKLQNPRISLISFKSMRHFKATMEYHRTKDILYVKELLGHVNIMNTLVYTHLVNFETDEWTCKVAKNLGEAVKLVEAGFNYITEMDAIKIFRKRK
jgi:integrase